MQFPGKGSPDKQTDFNGSEANYPKIKKKKDLPQKTPSPGNQANHKEKIKEKYKKVLGMLVEFIALHNTTKGIFHDIAKNLELKIKLDA